MGTHYFFPPANAYRLNKCLFLLKSDDTFRARYLDDPASAATEAGLDPETRAALVAFDRDRLVALGAHPYLVFMSGLRLKMENEGEAFEYF